jgi:eukaryotic-like serine/threonine-protein kinase
MNRMTAQFADSQRPWIGLASFTEGDREFFAGRGDEIEQLLRLVRRDTLTLLYGISGLGKTSLLQAGLFPLLREENYLPVPIRVDYLEGAGPLAKQVFDAISAAAAEARVDAPQPQPGQTLWEYFHRLDNHFWSPHNDLVTPFLTFDQFEEFFTLGRETADRIQRGMEFISELADLVENRPPAALRDNPTRAKQFSFKPVPVSVLLSMREDYLGDLDYIRSKFRALAQNRLRLRPMGEPQARQVIALGASLLAPGAADRIVKYVAGAGANGDSAEITVAPALLSLVLRELNERRLRGGPDAKITADLLDTEHEKILEDFYLQALKDLPVGVRKFVEDKLVTASGHRNSCALDDALTRPDVTQSALDKLVDRRLLAYEERHRMKRVEVTHDVLLPVIKASRDIRLTSEARAEADRLRARQAAERRKQQITATVAGALALALIGTIWACLYFLVWEHKDYYREFAKKNGFPVGVGKKLSPSDVSKVPVSFGLVHKGVVFDGWKVWKLDWKPAFRVEAVNGRLKLTTYHSVATYLWSEFESEDSQDDTPWKKGEQLGLQNVCQWEFVSTPAGKILYERGLDRDGRMVYGLTYSPPGSGSPSIRLARFVGPDGFPQLQRRSAAEYVEIHYDGAGWEYLIMYRDGKKRAVAGPYGAFGKSIQHNDRGQITQSLSLDAHEHAMIDNSGNSGMQTKYDDKGNDIEDTSVGPDLRLVPLKVGYTIQKSQYDESGRLHRATYCGVKGEPVLHKDGYHGWEAEYDEHGNQTVVTYLGLDGKPMPIADGYATYKSTYNPSGDLIRRTFHGVKGEAVLSKKYGYHGWETEYDEHGNQTVVTHLGLDRKPMPIADGYATMRLAYERYKPTRVRLYSVKGEPVLSKKYGYHGWEAKYDEHGNQTAMTYIGLDGKPMSIADGYATKKSTYDARDNPIGETYYGVTGEPVRHQNGYYGWEAEYDEHGNQTAMTYIGLDGKLTRMADGYATIKSTYNARDKRIRVRLYGINDEPVLSKTDGCHGLKTEYDEHDNPTVETYIGLDGKPTSIADGYATKKSTYDARGKLVRQTFHGVNGDPVLSKKDGYHGWEFEYDEHGNPTVQTYLGLDGKRMLIADGYATMKLTYDAADKPTRLMLYGVNGEPVRHKDGYYGEALEYVQQGNQTVVTYLGLDGKPMPIADGYMTKTLAYDARGKEIRRTFHGVKGEPVLSKKDGYYGREAEYDEHGNQTVETYIGLDGKPKPVADGYASLKSTYDARGKEIRRTFHGANGEPAQHKDGYYGWEAEYDENGNPTVKTYLGLNGKPVLSADGYAILKSTYDERGKETRRSYYGVNGEPIVDKDGNHGLETQYDEHGNEIKRIPFGLDGKPHP